jgi:hypothetical protein
MKLKTGIGGARLLTSPAREYARPTKGMKRNKTQSPSLLPLFASVQNPFRSPV